MLGAKHDTQKVHASKQFKSHAGQLTQRMISANWAASSQCWIIHWCAGCQKMDTARNAQQQAMKLVNHGAASNKATSQKDITVTGTGFTGTERAWVAAKCSELSIQCRGDLIPGVSTHLVCRNILNAVGSAKYVRALEWGVQIVSWQWLAKSAEQGCLLPVKQFKTDTSTPFPKLPISKTANHVSKPKLQQQQHTGRDFASDLTNTQVTQQGGHHAGKVENKLAVNSNRVQGSSVQQTAEFSFSIPQQRRQDPLPNNNSQGTPNAWPVNDPQPSCVLNASNIDANVSTHGNRLSQQVSHGSTSFAGFNTSTNARSGAKQSNDSGAASASIRSSSKAAANQLPERQRPCVEGVQLPLSEEEYDGPVIPATQAMDEDSDNDMFQEADLQKYLQARAASLGSTAFSYSNRSGMAPANTTGQQQHAPNNRSDVSAGNEGTVEHMQISPGPSTAVRKPNYTDYTPGSVTLTSLTPGTCNISTSMMAEMDAMLLSPAPQQHASRFSPHVPNEHLQRLSLDDGSELPDCSHPNTECVQGCSSPAGSMLISPACVKQSNKPSHISLTSSSEKSKTDMSEIDTTEDSNRRSLSSSGAPSVLYSGFESRLGETSEAMSSDGHTSDSHQNLTGDPTDNGHLAVPVTAMSLREALAIGRPAGGCDNACNGAFISVGSTSQLSLPASDSYVTKRRQHAQFPTGFTSSEASPNIMADAQGNQDVAQHMEDFELSLRDGLGTDTAELPVAHSRCESATTPAANDVPSSTGSGPSQHLVARAGVALDGAGEAGFRKHCMLAPTALQQKQNPSVKPEPMEQQQPGVVANPSWQSKQHSSIMINRGNQHNGHPNTHQSSSLLGPGLAQAWARVSDGGISDPAGQAGLHHVTPEPEPPSSNEPSPACMRMPVRVKPERQEQPTGIHRLVQSAQQPKSQSRTMSNNLTAANNSAQGVLKQLYKVLCPAFWHVRQASSGQEGSVSAYTVDAPDKLGRPPRCSTVKERHRNASTLHSKQITITTPGHLPMTLMSGDKAKRIMCPVIRTQQPGSGHTHSWIVAEPVTFYSLNGQWWMEYVQLFTLDAATARAQSAGAGLLQLPPEWSFQADREVLRDCCHQHCRITDVQFLVKVSRSQTDLSRSLKHPTPSLDDVAGMSLEQFAAQAEQKILVFQRHGFDSSTGMLIINAAAAATEESQM